MAKATKQQSPAQKEKLAAALVPKEEQPYNVPQNWCWVRLGSVSKIIMGQSPKGTEVTNDSSCLPLIGGASDIGELYPIISRYTKVANKLSEVGDIIICIRATLGRPVFADKIYCLGRGVAAVRANIISKKYILYCLIGLEQYFYDNAAGTTFLQITSTTLNEMPFPLPPLAEQNRIVCRIENFFAKLDAAKAKLVAALDTFAERKAAILHRAFTGELTAKWREENGVSVESWEEKTLNDVAEYKKGPFGSSITKSMFVPKGNSTYKVYEQGNAIRKTVSYGHYYITEQKYSELKNFAVNSGDIIVSCAGTIGEIYKLPEQCEQGIINQALMRVRLFDNIEEKFFIYYFGGVIKRDVVNEANGTAIQNIPPFKVMKAMEIFLPTLPEQKEIVRILDEIFANEAVAKAAVESAIDTIDTAKKSILARAFRGQLGTNDPADENACELLQRIIKESEGDAI